MREARWLAGLLLAAVLGLAGAVHGFTPTGSADATSRAPDDHAQAADPGKALFQGKGSCFACHGREAGGTQLGPDLTDAEWINFEARPTGDQMEELIRDGVARPKRHPAPMPPMGGARLSAAEIAQLATYVLSLTAGDD